MGVLLWCVSWADLFYSFHGLVHGWTPAPIFFVTPLVVGVTMVSVGPGKLSGGGSPVGFEIVMGEPSALRRRPDTLTVGRWGVATQGGEEQR